MADRSLADRLNAMQSSADTEEEFDEILISRHSPPAENRIAVEIRSTQTQYDLITTDRAALAKREKQA